MLPKLSHIGAIEKVIHHPAEFSSSPKPRCFHFPPLLEQQAFPLIALGALSMMVGVCNLLSNEMAAV